MEMQKLDIKPMNAGFSEGGGNFGSEHSLDICQGPVLMAARDACLHRQAFLFQFRFLNFLVREEIKSDLFCTLVSEVCALVEM